MKKITKASSEELEKHFLQVCEIIKREYNAVGEYCDRDGILNISVSFDGNWHKRGLSSLELEQLLIY